MSRSSLAEGDTLTLSLGDTHCRLQYIGSDEFGFEVRISLYNNQQFDKKLSSTEVLLQNGETFLAGAVEWRLTEKPDGGIILAITNSH